MESRAQRFRHRAADLRQMARTYTNRERRLQLELLAEDCDEIASSLRFDDRPKPAHRCPCGGRALDGDVAVSHLDAALVEYFCRFHPNMKGTITVEPH